MTILMTIFKIDLDTLKWELTVWCIIRNFQFTEESLFAEELLIYIYFSADRA